LLLDLVLCFSGLPLFCERLLRFDGLLSFLGKSCFDGSQPSLQVLHLRLRRSFGIGLLLGGVARGSWSLSA
jgi:hypothetical protein